MQTSLDLTRIPLCAYRDLLRAQNLLPSRRLLLDDLDTRFAALSAAGIATIADLLQALSSAARITRLSAAAGIAQDYLKVLRREAGTLKAKRVPLTDFPDLDPALLEALAQRGIRTAGEYLRDTNASCGELYCLCSLVQINGVGANAATMLYRAGYRSVADIAAATAEEMLSRIAADQAAKRYYQGTLGVKDMQFCIDFARTLETLSAAVR